MFSWAKLVVSWGLLQPWHRKMLQGLKSSEGHEELLGFSPLIVPFAYHPNIHLLWKSWKRDKHAEPQARKSLVLDFSSAAMRRRMKKWVSQYLTVWFMHCSELKLTLAKMARWESKSNPDMRLMLYISSINTQKYYMQERFMKAVSWPQGLCLHTAGFKHCLGTGWRTAAGQPRITPPSAWSPSKQLETWQAASFPLPSVSRGNCWEVFLVAF